MTKLYRRWPSYQAWRRYRVFGVTSSAWEYGATVALPYFAANDTLRLKITTVDSRTDEERERADDIEGFLRNAWEELRPRNDGEWRKEWLP